MDAVPPEIVVQILTYSSPEEVLRYKQLNSELRNLIVRNKTSLPLPLLTVAIYNEKEAKHVIYIDVIHHSNGRIRNCSFTYDYWDQCYGEGQLYTIFNYFFESKPLKLNLQGFIAILLEKAVLNIDLGLKGTTCVSDWSCKCASYCFDNRRLIDDLSEAILNSQNRIGTIALRPKGGYMENYFDELLDAVAENTSEVRPELIAYFTDGCEYMITPFIMDSINGMAPFFAKVTVEHHVDCTDGLCYEIAKAWTNKGFPAIHFSLFSKETDDSVRKATDFFLQQSTDNCSIVKKNVTHLVLFHQEHCESFIRFVDNETGNSIQFKKIENEPGMEDLIQIAITTEIVQNFRFENE